MSSATVFFLDAGIKSVSIIFFLMTGFAYATLLERRFIAAIQHRRGPNRAGPFGLLQPVADGIKLMFKEDIVPNKADKVVFVLAPTLISIPALVILAVVPFGGVVNIGSYQTRLGLSDVNVGVLYILAVASISVYGVVLAGWSSNNKYALLGGLRSTAQMISYELGMALSILAPVMLTGSLSMQAIVDAQQKLWFIFLQPVAGIIFYICSLAELNRVPFDLPDAEQELTAGFHAEYSGMKFALFTLGEYVKMIAVSMIFASLFLGGYQLFGLDHLLGGWMSLVIMATKVIISLMVMVWIRASIPRMRYDYLMAFGWKVLLPIALINLLVTAVLIVLIPGM